MSKSKFSDDPKAIHFQIRFVRDGGGSYYYFSALPKEDIGQKAADVANEEYLNKGYENAQFASFGYFKPIKSAPVVQWDREKKAPMKGGIKFKIRLFFFQATYASGRKERTEWYQADEIESKPKAHAKQK
jgi:hypothetical protein